MNDDLDLTEEEHQLADDIVFEMDKMFCDFLEGSSDPSTTISIVLNTSFYCSVLAMIRGGVSEAYVHELVNDLFTDVRNGMQ